MDNLACDADRGLGVRGDGGLDGVGWLERTVVFAIRRRPIGHCRIFYSAVIYIGKMPGSRENRIRNGVYGTKYIYDNSPATTYALNFLR